MPFEFLAAIFLGSIIGILLFFWLKSSLYRSDDSIFIFFFVCNVQDYFEGLVWDLRRISKWYGKDIMIFCVDMDSTDDTKLIIKNLDQKGFMRQLNARQASKTFQSCPIGKCWVFNLENNTEVKEIRKSLVKIFNEFTKSTTSKKELF